VFVATRKFLIVHPIPPKLALHIYSSRNRFGSTSNCIPKIMPKSLLESDSESDSSSSDDDHHYEPDEIKNNNSSSSNNYNNNTNHKDKAVRFSINSKYAQEYQSRKQKEELVKERERRQRYGEDDDDDGDSDNDDDSSSSSSSSSTDEDEDAELLTPNLDRDILKTINALRNKDETIYNSNVRFFSGSGNDDDDDDEKEDGEANKKKAKRPKVKRAKDVIREQILEQMDEDDNAAESSSTDKKKTSKAIPPELNDKTTRLAYDQQQQELRQAFLEKQKNDKSKSRNKNTDSAAADDDDDDDADSGDQKSDSDEEDDFLVIKKRHDPNTPRDDQTQQEYEQELKRLEASLGKTASSNDADKSSSYMDPRGEVENGEKFLLDFIKNKTWIDKTGQGGDYDADNSDAEESLQALETADNFEAKYNFRFEEAMQQAESTTATSGAHHSVVGYARSQTMNTLRRKDESRKEKRLARKERKAAERKAKEEKLRRLKNAKREEMEQKLKQVKAVLGAKTHPDRVVAAVGGGDDEGNGALHPDLQQDAPLDEAAIMKLLEGDYDPENFEKSMQDAFGDDFYQKEDAEWKTDDDVKKALQEDGDVEYINFDDDDTGGADGVEAYDGDDYEVKDGEEDGEAEEENYDYEDLAEGEGAEEDEETEIEKNVRAKMMDKLYELDYEDIVAGMPTRFKYREVEPNSYGLTTQEILLARDTTLKQYVSLKKMAPYNEGDEYNVNSRKRRKFREMLQQDIEDAERQLKEQGVTVNESHGSEAAGEDAEVTNKKKRRRMKKSGDKNKSIEKEDASKTNTERVDAMGSGTKENEDGKKKRRRKKKGKKISTPDSSKPVETVKSAMMSAPKAVTDPSKGTPEETITSNSRDLEAKKAKKKAKKKEKKVKVTGVSASRLASYDL